MKKTVYLDLDGTIADLYGIENWLPRLKASDETIFLECEPIITEEELLNHFPTDKYEIRVLSMTPLGATTEYCKNVAEQKNAWLDKYFPSITKRIYKAYGHNKNLKNSVNAILIDDSKPIRNSWKGIAINPAELWGWFFAVGAEPVALTDLRKLVSANGRKLYHHRPQKSSEKIKNF